MSERIDMSEALRGLRADRDALIEIAAGLSAAQWEAPSGCSGWTTKDVISHMAALFWSVVDGTAGPDTTGLELEDAVAVKVDARRAMTPGEVLADYEEVSDKAIDGLALVATLDMEIPFSESESYHASVVPLAFCFDHYIHIRADLFSPRGSLSGSPPASDELRLRPTLDWIEVALPKQNARALESLDGQISLVVNGPAARTIAFGEGEVVATIESDGPAFVRWITKRGDWETLGVKAEGSATALDVARALKVY